MKSKFINLFCLLVLTQCLNNVSAQENIDVTIDLGTNYQTMKGFGAALAYYEGWLTAHPNKSQIYEAIFGELSLDILRVRNAYDYDAGMIDRVKEFADAAEYVRGSRIPIMSSSWGPPGYLKSNGDRNNGGTLKYDVNGDVVDFDYSGFADWWNSSLDEYNANGVYPDYISIQNEPDWSASYESCRFEPTEKITATDTIAGYNKALDAVYDIIQQREQIPKILGPEVLGIGYDRLESYTNPLDLSELYGICHHLYHGVDESNPFASTDIPKVGKYHPEVPHFQTEYNRGDWYSLAGLIYKSLHDEDVVAYLYWDLIWDNGGLVSLEFPWGSSSWSTSNGYTRTKEFYAFKQYSAFIQPGWKRVDANLNGSKLKGVSFINPEQDSLALVFINTSSVEDLNIQINVPGYKINKSSVYKTSENMNCELSGELDGTIFIIEPHTIATVALSLNHFSGMNRYLKEGMNEIISKHHMYPNPASESTTLYFNISKSAEIDIKICDINGRIVCEHPAGLLSEGSKQQSIDVSFLDSGFYFYQILVDNTIRKSGILSVR